MTYFRNVKIGHSNLIRFGRTLITTYPSFVCCKHWAFSMCVNETVCVLFFFSCISMTSLLNRSDVGESWEVFFFQLLHKDSTILAWNPTSYCHWNRWKFHYTLQCDNRVSLLKYIFYKAQLDNEAKDSHHLTSCTFSDFCRIELVRLWEVQFISSHNHNRDFFFFCEIWVS